MVEQKLRVLESSFRLDHLELRRAFMTAYLQHLDHNAYHEFLNLCAKCGTNATLGDTIVAVEEYFSRNPIRLDALLACIPDGGPQENRHWWLARRGVNQLPSRPFFIMSGIGVGWYEKLILSHSFEVLDAGLLVFTVLLNPDPELVRARLDQILGRFADPLALPFKFGTINNVIPDPTLPEAMRAFKVRFFVHRSFASGSSGLLTHKRTTHQEVRRFYEILFPERSSFELSEPSPGK